MNLEEKTKHQIETDSRKDRVEILEFYIRIGKSEIRKSKDAIKEHMKANKQYEEELMDLRYEKTNTGEVKERKKRVETI
jgi:hypothetical protein